MYDLIISGGKIVTKENVIDTDIGVLDGRISAIGHCLGEASSHIDAGGHYVFPGVIDCHAHLNDPGFTWREDFAHGTMAAAAGGVTTVIDMPLQNEPALFNVEIFNAKHDTVAPSALVDYAFWGAALTSNIDCLAALNEAGCTAFKVFMGPVSPDYESLDLGFVRDVLKTVRNFSGLAGFHAEDYSIVKHEERKAKKAGLNLWENFLESRPVVAELIAVGNIIDLVRETGARAHICHVSHPSAAELIRKAKMEGLPLTAETCMHYLVFSEEDLIEKGSMFKCAPPLRKPETASKMWNYVADGTIDCISSDHSPCAPHEKDEESHDVFDVWGGISGIQTMMQMFFEHAVNRAGCSPSLIAESLSGRAAEIFGLYGRKGAIEVGFDADFVIFDPNREWEIVPESLYYLNPISAFIGQKGKGLPIKTIVRGKVVYEDGHRIVDYGYGRLIRARTV